MLNQHIQLSTMRKLTLILLLFVLNSVVYGQKTDKEILEFVNDGSVSQLVNKNTELLMAGRYRMAILVSAKLIEKEPNNHNFVYRHGYALAQQNIAYTEAINLLEKATQNTTLKYNASSNKETAAPIDAFYHLASCYHHEGNLEEARKNYELYISKAPKKAALKGFSELGLAQIENSKTTINKSESVKVRNIGAAINTAAPEYSPAVSLDGSALYFTSRRLWDDSSNAEYIDPRTDTYLEDIYVSYKDFDGQWEEPILLDFSSPSQNEATISVSSDERRLYIYSDQTGNGDIYYTEFQNGRFESIQDFSIEGVNTDSWEPHISVTPDGNTIYFVSDRKKEGLGGRDIYRITKLPDGTWSQPYNLGYPINTPYDEDAPFIAVDNKTLYFASNNENSIGGFDIFVSVMDEYGIWSSPINMGTPINSTGDDLYYTTTADGRFAYITSFRPDGFGEKDIYEIEDNFFNRNNTALLKGLITVIGNKPLPEDVNITIKCINCGETNVKTVYPRTSNNTYMSNLDKCREYEMTYAYDDGKTVFHTDKISTNCDDEYEEIYKPVLLDLDNWKIVPAYNYQLAGTVADADNNTGLAGALVEIMDENGNILESLTTDENGNYNSKVLEGKAYSDEVNLSIKVSKDGYLTYEDVLKPNLGDQEVVSNNIGLNKLDIGKDIGRMLAVNTIYFDLDKSNIRDSEKTKLDKIVKVLNDNPTLEIELGSHTDCRASKGYNLALSDRRAKSSAQYIKSRISNPNRIKSKGYGETQLVNDCACEGEIESNCSEEQHELNRRTEFKIIKL